MPRQGVPYPSREICSLKCQIDALQRQINELMKSINGVQGDGQGNLSLISGDPAIVINNDAVQNQIEIALDSSQLPAAAVSSVNSQTGAVVLEADDIPSDGNSDVQADIDALKALGVNLQGAINNEVTARGNADAALQGNINTLQASIPGEAAQAVANDPTVQQLAVDVPNKLDKITSGSALKAYTHTGATQGEKSVVDGTTADSIAIRDANGRLQAADPANGATDKTLVTANWVSQTGDSSPNNIIHETGIESMRNKRIYDAQIRLESGRTSSTYCYEICHITSTTASTVYNFSCIISTRAETGFVRVAVTTNASNDGIAEVTTSYSGANAKTTKMGAYIDADRKLILTMRPATNNVNMAATVLNAYGGAGYVMNVWFTNYLTQRMITAITGYTEEA